MNTDNISSLSIPSAPNEKNAFPYETCTYLDIEFQSEIE